MSCCVVHSLTRPDDPSAEPEVSHSLISLLESMVPEYLGNMIAIKTIQVLFDFVLRALTVPDIMPKGASAGFWVSLVHLSRSI